MKGTGSLPPRFRRTASGWPAAATVACDETLLLLETATNGVQRTLPGHYHHRGCVAFSPDGRYLASVSDGWGQIANRTIRVFEMATATEIHSFKNELPVFAVAFSPD